jgi:hypothetical protein
MIPAGIVDRMATRRWMSVRRFLGRNRLAVVLAILIGALIAGGAFGVIAPVPSASATARGGPIAVPVPAQVRIRKTAGAEAYVPTRLPFGTHYGFRIWSFARATKTLYIRFADLRFAPGTHPLYFTIVPFRQPLARCADGKQKIIAYDGNRVYSNGREAWRCIAGAKGVVKVTATGPHLPDVAFARVVASAKRLAYRPDGKS